MNDGPMAQEGKKGHRLMALGGDTYAEVSLFKGKTYASIRRWFQADNGSWYRTKNGLNMPLKEMLDVLNHNDELVAFLDAESEQPFDDNKEESGERGW